MNEILTASPRATGSTSGPAPSPLLANEPLTLDVRPLLARGESPCTAIDDAAGRVAVGQSLILLAPFEPVPLYAKLARQGFQANPQPLAEGAWRVEFHRVESGEPNPAGNSGSCACGQA